MALIFLGMLVMGSSVFARLACDPDCLANAKNTFRGCIATCKEEFQTAKDGCRNIDHECAEGCRVAYEGCVLTPLAELADCKATNCNPPLTRAIENCRALYQKGEDRDKCIDQAQVVAFQCRDECRETANPLLKACSDTFKACMIGCKLPAP